MTAKMTASDVADWLEDASQTFKALHGDPPSVYREAVQKIRENLIPRWLDEPVHPKIEGARYHYWVEGQPYPNVLQWNGDYWIIKGLFGSWDSLRDRSVWPIEGPPRK